MPRVKIPCAEAKTCYSQIFFLKQFYCYVIHIPHNSPLYSVQLQFSSFSKNMERFTNLRVILVQGHANLLCIVPILVYVLPK